MKYAASHRLYPIHDSNERTASVGAYSQLAVIIEAHRPNVTIVTHDQGMATPSVNHGSRSHVTHHHRCGSIGCGAITKLVVPVRTPRPDHCIVLDRQRVVTARRYRDDIANACHANSRVAR
jgi:hypothetical protein